MTKKRLSLLAGVVLAVAAMLVSFSQKSSVTTGIVKINGGAGTVIKTWKDHKGNHCYVLTACHVTENSDKLEISFLRINKSGNITQKHVVTGKVVESNYLLDYAMIKCDVDFNVDVVKCIPPRCFDPPELLDEIFVVGFPAHEPYWVSEGELTSICNGVYTHNAHIWYGCSGGPLLDSHYRQIGINVRIKFNGIPLSFIGYSIPLNTVYKSLGSEKTLKYFGFST